MSEINQIRSQNCHSRLTTQKYLSLPDRCIKYRQYHTNTSVPKQHVFYAVVLTNVTLSRTLFEQRILHQMPDDVFNFFRECLENMDLDGEEHPRYVVYVRSVSSACLKTGSKSKILALL